MYIRLAFWTLSLAYTSAILSGSIHASSPSIMLTAALLGALLGFSLGGIFINTDGVSLWPAYRRPFDLIFQHAKTEDRTALADDFRTFLLNPDTFELTLSAV